MPKKILVVDDSPTELKAMVGALKVRDWQIITAVDGEEALEKSEKERPDLLVLDIVLPKKNGFQVCRQLKTTPETKDIKIVLVSSKGQETDRFWGIKQGADEYIVKPFTDDALVAAVSRQL
jgi:DNA-binding response OmpR family regulator